MVMTDAEVMVDESRGLSQETITRLQAPLPPEMIQVNDFDRSKPDFEFMSHDDIVRQANEIFGYDNWGWEVVGGVDLHIAGDGTPFYQVLVKITVMGVPSRMGVGIWPVQKNRSTGKDSVSSHSTAAPSAITRALKSAFKSFGSQFGLELARSHREGGGRGFAPAAAQGRRQGDQQWSHQPPASQDAGNRGGRATPNPPEDARGPANGQTQARGPEAPPQQHRPNGPQRQQTAGSDTGQGPQLQKVDLPRLKSWLDERGIEIEDGNRLMGVPYFGTKSIQELMAQKGLSSVEALIADLENQLETTATAGGWN